ncbi:pyridoxal phosphate-dependent decarboxylase family protein [Flaviaesturariibacter amylovorans]|uniref:Pyridoxal-dependent decarboxylase n=1 Tax=Flaviaesturariibacter amylovorans TaxID=1084520 RepID=A0ABP8H0I7_9BACT
MHPTLAKDFESLPSLLYQAMSLSADYLDGLNEHPVSRPAPVTAETTLPEDGVGTTGALKAFYATHANTVVASSGPRYWGFVTGGTTPAAIAGDWLSTVFDQNTQSTKGPGGSTAAVEVETIGLLLDLLGLPATFQGGFVTGATMANFTGLAVARQWAGRQLGFDAARSGVQPGIVVLSATPHSSAVKALSLLGLGSSNIIPLRTLDADREALDPADLEEKLEQYKHSAVILVSSGGTVNSVDFDDMTAIAGLRGRYRFYWHVDAAFGAFAALSPGHRPLLEGWDAADSIAVDCHKWMNVPYDSAFYLVRKEHASLQVQTFQNSNAPYLGDPEADFTYLNFGPENSRRFRALPVWISLQAYGRSGFRWMVEHSIERAQSFARRLAGETPFRVCAPVHLNVVCFTIPGADAGALTAVLDILNARGRVFFTPSAYRGTPCIRAAFVNWRTTEPDIDIAIGELRAAAGQLSGTATED